MSVAENLNLIQQEIRKAEIKYQRPENSVKLIAVSKTYPVSQILLAADAGQQDFGENKVQEMAAKYQEAPHVRWHLIGHLQSNKVKYIIPFVHMIHSVDSVKLTEIIQQQAAKQNRIVNILLQIFISGEDTKTGMSPEEAKDILLKAAAYPNIKFCGCMGMAALTDDRNIIHQQFALLRNCMQELKNISAENIDLKELSMGMSGDFDIAIAEGATMVRIGSAIFGNRNYI